jgi:hypothetical protein
MIMHELEKFVMQMDFAYFKALFKHLPGATDEKHGRRGQYIRYVDQSSHPWPPQHTTAMFGVYKPALPWNVARSYTNFSEKYMLRL